MPAHAHCAACSTAPVSLCRMNSVWGHRLALVSAPERQGWVLHVLASPWALACIVLWQCACLGRVRDSAGRCARQRRDTEHTQCDVGLKVYAGMIDAELDSRGYIVPGLGDAGDRAFGTA